MNQQDKIDFTAYLQAKNIWKTSIERYLLQIEQFGEWLQENNEKTLQSAEKKDVLDYLQVLQNRNLSGSTRQHRLGVLGYYYRFLIQTEQASVNPTIGIKLRGTRKKVLHQILNMEELEELLDTHFVLKVQNSQEEKTDIKGRFLSSRHTHLRNHLILSFYVYQGLTRSNWQALTMNDLDLQKATITIKSQRQSNARTLPLHATQIGIIYSYLNESRPHYKLNEEMLFNPKFQTQEWMKELANLYPKFEEFAQLRASIITYWIKTEGLRKAQYKAGHRYISSTESYLNNDLSALQDNVERFHPLK